MCRKSAALSSRSPSLTSQRQLSDFTLSNIEISIPPKSDYIALVRRLTGAVTAMSSPLSQTDIDDLILSISEAATNAVHAHSDRGTDRPITIKFSFDPTALTVEVRDRGGGFSPHMMDELPDVTDPERLDFEHGLGVYLYCMHTDEHEITSSRRGTRVRLVKNYKQDESSQNGS